LVLYREKIILPYLYPYIQQIKEANPNNKVWFVDYNVGLYGKAHKSLADMAKALDIKRVPFCHQILQIFTQLRILSTILRIQSMDIRLATHL
jgi:hypothetical protein